MMKIKRNGFPVRVFVKSDAIRGLRVIYACKHITTLVVRARKGRFVPDGARGDDFVQGPVQGGRRLVRLSEEMNRSEWKAAMQQNGFC